MGCRPSKTNKRSNTIVYQFDKTDILQVDRFFNKVEPLLIKGETIRKRLYETVKECYKNAGTSHLPVNKYMETIQVLLWSLSAGANGQILRSGVKIVNGPPYISCSSSGLCDETVLLYKSLRDYFAVITDHATTLKNTVIDLTAMKNELLKGRNRIDEKELRKTCDEYIRNMNKFNVALQSIKELAKTMQNARNVVKRSISKVKTLADQADEVGRKAYAQNLIKPIEIFNEFGVRPKKVRREVDLDISDYDEEDIEQLEDDFQDQEQPVDQKRSKSVNKNVSFELDEEDPPKTRGRNRSVHNNLDQKSSVAKRMDSSDNSPDESSSRYASEQRQTFGQGLRDPSNPQKLNKIQVNALEMKDLASQKQLMDSDSYIPRYKYYTPQKNEVERPIKTFSDPFEINRKPFNLLDNLIIHEPIKKEEIIKKNEAIKKEENTAREVIDIVALTKQYLAQNQPYQTTNRRDEDVEDDEPEKNLPEERSEDLVSFSEKRRHYLINLKS